MSERSRQILTRTAWVTAQILLVMIILLVTAAMWMSFLPEYFPFLGRWVKSL